MVEHLLTMTLFKGTAAVDVKGAFMDRRTPIRDHEIAVKIIRPAHAVARGAGAVAAVEGEQTRIEIGKTQVARRTVKFEAVQMFVVFGCEDRTRTLPEHEGAVEQLIHPFTPLPVDHNCANDKVDVVFAVAVERRPFVQRGDRAVDSHVG